MAFPELMWFFTACASLFLVFPSYFSATFIFQPLHK